MELKIKNFAKIKEASIKLEGITVIAGENNTGKSTIGKILFASFNSLNNIDAKVEKEINLSVRNLLMSFLEFISFYTKRKNGIINRIPNNKILSNILNDINKKEEDIEKIIINNIEKYIDINDKSIYKNIEYTVNKIKEYKNISYEKLSFNIVSEYYNELFYNQINSRIDKDTMAEITIKDFGISFEFQNDKCSNIKKDFHNNNAFFIYDPFVLDRIHYSRLIIDSHLTDKILTAYNRNYIVDKTLAEEKLDIVYNKLSNAINGIIKKEKVKENNDFSLDSETFSEPISIHNLSAGLKSFTIIKMMLEKNILKEKDILILDEPEIHLHPRWQLLYAEIIVLIQKVFNLYIVITTHSPYFLDAIEIFTKHYSIENKTNYYLSNIENNYSVISLVNDRTDNIYSKMASPIEDLVDELGDN